MAFLNLHRALDSCHKHVGVLRLSRRELERRSKDTEEFFQLVGAEIGKLARGGFDIEGTQIPDLIEDPDRSSLLRRDTDVEHQVLFSRAIVAKFRKVYAGQCGSVIDCLVRTPTPVMQLMLDARTMLDTRADGHDGDDLCRDLSPWTGRRKGHNGSDVGCNESLPLERKKFCPPPATPESTSCHVVYTDFHYSSLEDKSTLVRAIGPILSFPEPWETLNKTEPRVIVLFRNETVQNETVQNETARSLEYRGVGWGLELIRWRGEGLLRVGRVHPRSPAAACGLRPHDVIISLNGRMVRGATWTLPLLCCAVLGLPLCAKKKSDDCLAVMSSALEACNKNGPVRGPVVLQVQRTEEQEISNISDVSRLDDTPVKSVARTETLRHTSVVGDQSSVDAPASKALGRVVRSPDGQTEISGLRAAVFATKPGQVVAPVIAAPHDDSGQFSERGPGTRQLTDMQGSVTSQVEIATLSRIVPVLMSAVLRTLNQRAPLKVENLYEAQGLNTVWTKVETAVFLEAVHRNMPMLGARLLCPRYSLNTILSQAEQLARHRDRLDRVPRVHKLVFESL
jgi:PDZ domain